MTKDYVYQYFIDGGCNCAESILYAANRSHNLQIPQEAFHMAAGFGGGMAYGLTCGALCGSMAALGMRYVEKNAHSTPGFREKCARLSQLFVEEFGSDACRDLLEHHKDKEFRCLKLVQRTAELLDQVMDQPPQPKEENI